MNSNTNTSFASSSSASSASSASSTSEQKKPKVAIKKQDMSSRTALSVQKHLDRMKLAKEKVLQKPSEDKVPQASDKADYTSPNAGFSWRKIVAIPKIIVIDPEENAFEVRNPDRWVHYHADHAAPAVPGQPDYLHYDEELLFPYERVIPRKRLDEESDEDKVESEFAELVEFIVEESTEEAEPTELVEPVVEKNIEGIQRLIKAKNGCKNSGEADGNKVDRQDDSKEHEHNWALDWEDCWKELDSDEEDIEENQKAREQLNKQVEQEERNKENRKPGAGGKRGNGGKEGKLGKRGKGGNGGKGTKGGKGRNTDGVL